MKVFPCRIILVFVVFIATVLTLCSGCGLVRTYKCTSDLEQEMFNVAVRNIHPDDVRITPKGYLDNVVVAWAGRIIECSYNEGENEVDAELVVEHHFFDWMEDFKLGDNIYVLSPRGEGRFKTTWTLRLDYGMEEVKRWTAVGNMAVVYGMPVSVDEGIIKLEAYCVRLVMPHRFKFADYPYGRDAGYQY